MSILTPVLRTGGGGAGVGGASEIIEVVNFVAAPTGTSGTLDLSRFHTVEAYVKLAPNVDINDLVFRISDDDGVSFNDNDYDYHLTSVEAGNPSPIQRTTAGSVGFFPLDSTAGNGLGAAATESGTFRFTLGNPNDTATYKACYYRSAYTNAVNVGHGGWGAGVRKITGAIDKIQIGSLGNLITGRMVIIGYLFQ